MLRPHAAGNLRGLPLHFAGDGPHEVAGLDLLHGGVSHGVRRTAKAMHALNCRAAFYFIQLGLHILGRVFSTGICLAKETQNTKNKDQAPTPTLRYTFATDLYQETGKIRLV